MPQSDSIPQALTTTCPLDCPDACKLSVTLKDDRIIKIDGAKDDPCTDGYICGKVRKYSDHVYSTERILTPLRRTGPKGSGDFSAITWDEAYTAIADRITHDRDKYGGESILPVCYGGSNGKLTQDSIDARFFYRVGASHLDRTVCAAPSGAAFQALYGKMPGTAYQDYADSQLIVIWGNNPHASGIHLVPHVQQALRQGAKLVVIDPRQNATGSQRHTPFTYLPRNGPCRGAGNDSLARRGRFCGLFVSRETHQRIRTVTCSSQQLDNRSGRVRRSSSTPVVRNVLSMLRGNQPSRDPMWLGSRTKPKWRKRHCRNLGDSCRREQVLAIGRIYDEQLGGVAD